MVRISDARMSGTAFGTIVLHVTPEAAVGGPLGLVRNGDRIRLSASRERRLDLLVDEDELARRRAALRRRAPAPARGYARLYHDHVLQADRGCDFDFLRASPPELKAARSRRLSRLRSGAARVEPRAAAPRSGGLLTGRLVEGCRAQEPLQLVGRARAPRRIRRPHPGVPKADHRHGRRDRIGEIEERVQQVHRLLPHDASTEI